MLKEVIENIFRDMLFLFLQQEPFFQEKNNSFLNFVLFNKNIESDIFNRLMDVFFLVQKFAEHCSVQISEWQMYFSITIFWKLYLMKINYSHELFNDFFQLSSKVFFWRGFPFYEVYRLLHSSALHPSHIGLVITNGIGLKLAKRVIPKTIEKGFSSFCDV